MHSPFYIAKSVRLNQVSFLFVYYKASNNLHKTIKQNALKNMKENTNSINLRMVSQFKVL